MELKVNDSSTWRTITEVKVNDSGTWRNITTIAVNDSGTWRTVFTSGAINASWTTWNVTVQTSSPTVPLAAMQLEANGAITKVGVGAGSIEWWTPSGSANGAAYWARCTVTSGSATVNEMSGWTQLSTTRTIYHSRPVVGASSITFTLEIATDSGGSNVVATWAGNVLQAIMIP